MKNLTDCWWQIPPFGKDFQALALVKKGEFANFGAILHFGTALV
jgi:hypothetical protein